MAFKFTKNNGIKQAVASTMQTFNNVENIAKLNDAIKNVRVKPTIQTMQLIKENLMPISSFSTNQNTNEIIEKLDSIIEKLNVAKPAKIKEYQGTDPFQKMQYETMMKVKMEEYNETAKKEAAELADKITKLDEMRKNILNNWLMRVQENIGEIGNQCMNLTMCVDEKEVKDFVNFSKNYKPGTAIPDEYNILIDKLNEFAKKNNVKWNELPDKKMEEIAEEVIQKRVIQFGKNKDIELQKMLEELLKMQDYFLLESIKNAFDEGSLIKYLREHGIQNEKLEAQINEIGNEIKLDEIFAGIKEKIEKLKYGEGADVKGDINKIIKNKIDLGIEKLKNEEIAQIKQTSGNKLSEEINKFVEFKKMYKPGMNIPQEYSKIVEELSDVAAPGNWYEFSDIAKIINKNKKIVKLFEEKLTDQIKIDKINEKYNKIKSVIIDDYIKSKFTRTVHHDALFNYLYKLNDTEKEVKLDEFYVVFVGNIMDSTNHIAEMLDYNKLSNKHIEIYKKCLQFIK